MIGEIIGDTEDDKKCNNGGNTKAEGRAKADVDVTVDGGAKVDEGVRDGGGAGSSSTAGAGRNNEIDLEEQLRSPAAWAGTSKKIDLEDRIASPRTDGGKGIKDLNPPKSDSSKGKEEIEEGKVSYSSALVAGSSMANISLEFVVEDGVAEVEIPEELFEGVDPLWRSFVVGYFMNDAPHIGPIHATVNRIWNTPGKRSKIDIQFIGKNDSFVQNRGCSHEKQDS